MTPPKPETLHRASVRFSLSATHPGGLAIPSSEKSDVVISRSACCKYFSVTPPSSAAIFTAAAIRSIGEPPCTDDASLFVTCPAPIITGIFSEFIFQLPFISLFLKMFYSCCLCRTTHAVRLWPVPILLFVRPAVLCPRD